MAATIERRGQLVVVHGSHALVNGSSEVEWTGLPTHGPKVRPAWVVYVNDRPVSADPRDDHAAA